MKFRVLSPKELLIDQLNIQNEFKEIESHEEAKKAQSKQNTKYSS